MDDANNMPIEPLPKIWRDGGSILLGDMEILPGAHLTLHQFKQEGKEQLSSS